MQKILYVVCLLIGMATATTGQDKILYEFKVEGACGMCKDRIENVANSHKGASHADWNLGTKMLSVVIDESKTSISALRTAIAQAGHDNGDFIAPQEVYEDLHGCCKYRMEEYPSDDELMNVFNEVKHVNEGDSHKQDSHSHAHFIQGRIYEVDDSGEVTPLIGATIKIAGTEVGTTTNFEGYFELDNTTAHGKAIDISYVGYTDKRIQLSEDGLVDIVLNAGHELETVEISYKKRTTEVSFLKPINVESITREELCKAACCNLSESFETNPSVDVAFSDAVTGTKQIQMLGLAGPYVQMTRELIPDIRGMSSIYGLSMTPGPWIESIQLIKGAGSVVNGFESMTGQINVELKKPDEAEILHINGFVNQGGRLEFNSNYRMDVSPFVSTSFLVHGKRLKSVHDNNGDSFTDMPLEEDFILANRWKFKQKGNFMGQVGVKISSLSHEGGSHDHFSGANEEHDKHWRMKSEMDRFEIWSKIGYVNPNNPKNSVGLQLSAVRHEQDAEFANDIYDAEQNFFSANLIYQNIYSDSHTLRMGASYQLDEIDERVGRAGGGFFSRYESVPGVFAEYTFKRDSKFAIIPGIRVDHHNNYSWFVTPRLHTKYNFADRSIIRLTAGRGLKTANIFAENLGLFSSARAIDLQASSTNNPYGLDAEVAWNYGINFSQGFDISSREFLISVDLYRTDFENQIVVDWETAGKISFYNLDGKSYSNSFQVKFEYELVNNLNVRTAYRMFDVKTEYQEGLLEKPMVAKHRAFINMAYKIESDWHFDATLNWNGQKRLPDTSSNPEKYQRPDRSEDYFIMNAQIMKRWGTKWDIYLGVENLFDYKQSDAIIAADDPFGQYFDASIVWAPLFGTNVYLGFRYNLNSQ